MLPIIRRGTRVSGGEPGVAMGSHARRMWRVVAAGSAGLVCAVALAGCGPLPTVVVVQSGVAFEGGTCEIVVNATNVAANTTYGIGMYTTGSPVELGELTSNSSGSIYGGRVSYPSKTLPHQYSNLYVEVYAVQSGQFGAGLALAKVTIAVCLPTGLAA
jgi:hypothetical protein